MPLVKKKHHRHQHQNVLAGDTDTIRKLDTCELISGTRLENPGLPPCPILNDSQRSQPIVMSDSIRSEIRECGSAVISLITTSVHMIVSAEC